MTELMDAILGDRTGALEALSKRSPDVLRPLMDAIQRSDDAIRSNLQRAAEAMRGDPVTAPCDLAAAHELVEARLVELRRNPQTFSALGEGETHNILIEIAARRRLTGRQIEIDRWMKAWL
jgi:hypothetical protein